MKLVQQTTPDSCTSACLAMITGLPVEQVMAEFHADWRAKLNDPARYLTSKGVAFTVNTNPFNHTAEWGNVYLLTVPSLNIEGGLHHIVMDLTNDTEIILDPNEGRFGKKFYTGWSHQSKTPFAVKLSAFLIDLMISGGSSD